MNGWGVAAVVLGALSPWVGYFAGKRQARGEMFAVLKEALDHALKVAPEKSPGARGVTFAHLCIIDRCKRRGWL